MWWLVIGGAMAFPNPTEIRVEFTNGGVEAVASTGCGSEYLDALPKLLAQLERCEGSYTVPWLAETGEVDWGAIGDRAKLMRPCWEPLLRVWPRATPLNEPLLGVCRVDIRRWPTPSGAAVGGLGEVSSGGESPTVKGDVAFTTEDMVYEPLLRRNVGQLRYCYDQRLKSNPELQGELSVSGKIDRGRPTFTATRDGLGDPELTACILGKMKRWTFATDGLLSVDFRFSRAP